MRGSTAKQRRVWQRAAPSYDRKMDGVDRGILAGGREWIGSRAHGRVLEVAIGTGRSLPHYRADVVLTGVDLSPAMLDVARRRAVDLGLDPHLQEADAEHLPFDDDRFDTVVCALAMCSIPDRAAALAEMRRVLVPGGTLLLLDHIGSTVPPIWLAQRIAELVSVPLAGEYFTRRQLALVQAAGFEVAERERLKAGMVERIRATCPA